MSNQELIERLKAKLGEYDDDASLETQDDYREWATQTAALLGYNPSFRSAFNMHAAYLNNPNLSSKAIASELNSMHALLSRAVAELEVEHLVAPFSEKIPLLPPEKITLKWLFSHLPINIWLGAVGLMASVFMLGVAVGYSDVYRKVIAPAIAMVKAAEPSVSALNNSSKGAPNGAP